MGGIYKKKTSNFFTEADILAVKVQLETSKPKEKFNKDASTQVNYGLSKKRKGMFFF